MKNSFGPWATALNFGPNPQLSAFWKRRMAMLVPASRSRRRLSWSAAMCLIVAAVLVGAFPTLRKASALSEKNEATVTPAGDRDENRPDTPPEDVSNSVGMKLRLIPAGEFMMGSTKDEEGMPSHGENESRSAGEGPAHRVRITKPFYLGVYEVTQGEWEKVMGATLKRQGRAAWAWGIRGRGADFPAYDLSWYDAVAFCNRLSEAEQRDPYYRITDVQPHPSLTPAIAGATVSIVGGNGYHLPTEAQWEYACRAGTTTPFAFGETLSPKTDARFGTWPQAELTVKVGSYRPNAWGLYDMHGNVLEWCQDWFGRDYYATSPENDPTGPISGDQRVMRGGALDVAAGMCRSACRTSERPGNRVYLYGFRVALDAAEKHQQATGLTGTGQGDSSAADATEADAQEAVDDFLDRVESPTPPQKGRRRLHVRNSDGQITALKLKGVELKKGDASVIGRLRYLETLDLSGTNVTDEDLRQLRGLTNLRELNLWDTSVDGSGLAHLGDLDRLETLDLGDAKVTDEALPHLEGLDGLRRLTLNRNGITDSGLAHLGKLRRLVALKLGETDVTDEGLRHLAGLKDLRSLTLDETKISQSGLEYLAEFPNLEWIASPVGTAEELVRRMERGDYQAADDMLTVGLFLPRRGQFQLQKLEALPKTERDDERSRRQFRMEMHWKAEYDPMPESPGISFPKFDGTFFAVLAVGRGAIRVLRTGILED